MTSPKPAATDTLVKKTEVLPADNTALVTETIQAEKSKLQALPEQKEPEFIQKESNSLAQTPAPQRAQLSTSKPNEIALKERKAITRDPKNTDVLAMHRAHVATSEIKLQKLTQDLNQVPPITAPQQVQMDVDPLEETYHAPSVANQEQRATEPTLQANNSNRETVPVLKYLYSTVLFMLVFLVITTRLND